jgi:hypothetical protein
VRLSKEPLHADVSVDAVIDRVTQGLTRVPKERHMLHLVLREGFNRHRVLITMNDRRIYDAADVSTDAEVARADAREVVSRSRAAHLVVSVTPGNRAAAFDVDVAISPYVAISLIGESTISFETSAVPFS